MLHMSVLSDDSTKSSSKQHAQAATRDHVEHLFIYSFYAFIEIKKLCYVSIHKTVVYFI